MMALLKRSALPLSLAANVFFVAVIVVHLWYRPPFPPHGGPGGPVEEIARALPPADAAIFREAFSGEPLLQGPPPGPGRDDDSGIDQALIAEPFDAAALEAAFRAREHEKQRFGQALGRALVRAASAMSAEGRRKLVEWQSQHRPPPRPGEHRPPPPR